MLAVAGLAPNWQALHLAVERCVVAGDLPGVLRSLEQMQAAGVEPHMALLERCVRRAEVAGDRDALRSLLTFMVAGDYRVVGAASKASRTLVWVWVLGGGGHPGVVWCGAPTHRRALVRLVAQAGDRGQAGKRVA